MRGSNFRVLTGATALTWAVAAVPGVAARSQVCLASVDGLVKCTKRLSIGARVGIGLGLCILISTVLSLILCLCLRQRRARRELAIAQVYQVEPSQIQGPLPTAYVTSFDPRSPSAYPHTPEVPEPAFVSPAGIPLPPSANFPVSGKSDTYPATLMRYGTTNGNGGGGLRPPKTAPVNQGSGTSMGYPFQGYSPNVSPSNQHPYTAFTGGFPRPMYAGQNLRDDWREVHKDTV